MTTTKKELVIKLKQLVSDLLKTKSVSNSTCNSKTKDKYKHEEAVESILLKNGFTKMNFDCKKKKQILVTRHAKNWRVFIDDVIEGKEKCDFMNNNTFIYQPRGQQDNPDFLVKIGKEFVIPIECKSSNQTFPHYNSGGIKSNYLYVFYSSFVNETTVYFGKDIQSDEISRLIDETDEKLKEIVKKANEQLKSWEFNKYRIEFYPRKMINTVVDYFKHDKRKENEELALDRLCNMLKEKAKV